MFIHSINSIKLLVYINNIVASPKKQRKLNWFYKILLERFKAKNLGKINKILGARITCNKKNQTLKINQEQYLKSVLDKFGITYKTYKPKAISVVKYKDL
jgi:hypothetical protein